MKPSVVNQGHFDMVLPSQDSTPTPGKLRSRSTEQDVIHQLHSELLALVRIAPDDAIASWQKAPIRLGDWTYSRLESEIYRFLW